VLEARRAIELGALLQRGGGVYRYADLALHDLVDVASPRAQTFAQQTLGPLARAAARPYRETLRALCAQGFRLKPAAAALEIHPHTLSYRMTQMRRRYGLDLADAQTRLRVALALLILGQ
jgi:purine catabolism regulator